MKDVVMLRFELRAYRPEDLDLIAALDNVCFEAPFRFSRAAMKRFAGTANAIVRLVWAIDESAGTEEAAGFCILHMERARIPRGYIVTLDVAPRYRHGGVGQSLMRAAEELAWRAGAGEMALHVSVSNSAAIQLYERLGYKPLRLESGFYGEGGDAFLYTRSLQPRDDLEPIGGLLEGDQSSS